MKDSLLQQANVNPLSVDGTGLVMVVHPEHDPCGEGALGSRSVLDAQEQQLEATLEDRGVRGAFLSCGGKELPLAFADIRREEERVGVTVSAAVHPSCPHKGEPIVLGAISVADAEAWEREMAQAMERVNGKHWGVSKAVIREQRDRWAAEGERCRGMTVAEYFEAIGLGQVYEQTWGWCAAVLAELEAKENKTAADRKEIAYYKRKVDRTEKYEDMELTDWMNVLKHQDLAGPPRTELEHPERKVAYASLIADQTDGSGRRKVGRATVFVSHVWKMTAKDFFEVCLAEMGEEDYAWIDLYLHNQYQGAVSDIGDDNSEYWIAKFGELIRGIGKVIAIVTEWEKPVMLTRIWCLFELNAAIDTGAELRFVSTAAERQDLSLNLSRVFRCLEARVSSIEVRDCDAKRPHEIQDKAIFLGKLRGIEDEVNAKLRREMRRWLAEAAEGVLSRTDPHRLPLTEAELALEEATIGEGKLGVTRYCCVGSFERWPRRLPLLGVLALLGAIGLWATLPLGTTVPWAHLLAALGCSLVPLAVLCGWVCHYPKLTGAKATRLLERRPRLPAVLHGLELGCMAALVAGVWWFGIRALVWRGDHSKDEDAPAIFGGFFLFMFLGVWLQRLAVHLHEHQVARQLRRPPLLSPRAFQQRRAITAAAFLLGMVGLPLAADLALGEPGVEVKDVDKTMAPIMSAVYAFFLGLGAAAGITALARGPGEVADRRARLCAQVGWLRLALGEAGKAAEIFGTVHEERLQVAGRDDVEYSYGAAPGYARALREADRKEEAEELARQVEAAAERNAGSWRRFLRPSGLDSGRVLVAVPLVVGTIVGLVVSGSAGAAAAVLLFTVLFLLNMVPPRAVDWKDRGALLRARMAAAVGAPDAEVLGLLQEAGRTDWGSRYPLDANEPELAAFLGRMNGDEAPADEQEKWEALPPLMRSAGDNPLSAWVKYTCEGRACYKRDDPQELSLEPPVDGVQQVAEAGMPGLDWSPQQWESAYADLGGPECWSDPRNRRYKLTVKAKKAGWALFFLGVLVALFCAAFVYVDCGEHGSWGVGSCTCDGNFIDLHHEPCGEECDCNGRGTQLDIAGARAAGSCDGGSCACIDGFVGAFCQFAPAYIVSGAVHSKYDGRYERLADAECGALHGKPVYQLGGEGGYVLFMPTHRSDLVGLGYIRSWRVGTSDRITDCAAIPVIHAPIGGHSCETPDGAGCAGTYVDDFRALGGGWPQSSIEIYRCPAANPCCGIDCGAHGTLNGNSAEACECRCADGYSGDRCQLAPAGTCMAEAYTVSGAADSKYDGRYERLAAECGGKPVYQLGGEGGYVLFHPTDTSSWMVGYSGHITSCAHTGGWITSSGNGGVCPRSPDGGGCAGRWQEYDGDAWQDAPPIVVDRWCPTDDPCCGIDCGAHGTLVGSSTEACECRCADGYSGDRCQLAPLPPLPAGMAEAYIIAGAAESEYDGQYERRAEECSDTPVYQAGEYGYVLFQPTDRSFWMVGASDSSTSCAATGWITSYGNGGVCPRSPDGGGCAGRWREWDGDAWHDAPGLAVSTCPGADPC
eukprot:COSAG04_NODE_942_length_9261_cov_7.725278_5_plen_1550_part_00